MVKALSRAQRIAIGYMMGTWMPHGHMLGSATAFGCDCLGCVRRAEFCEYASPCSAAPGAMAIYCSKHWNMKSPGLNSTPRERATSLKGSQR